MRVMQSSVPSLDIKKVMKERDYYKKHAVKYGSQNCVAPFLNLLLVICSFICDNFITDRQFSQRTNFTKIGYLIKPFLYPLAI